MRTAGQPILPSGLPLIREAFFQLAKVLKGERLAHPLTLARGAMRSLAEALRDALEVGLGLAAIDLRS
jgi:hypothetical protein